MHINWMFEAVYAVCNEALTYSQLQLLLLEVVEKEVVV